MQFKATYPTPAEHTPGVNECLFLVLHHTGTGSGTIKGVLDGLNKREDFASCQYVVGEERDVYKIGEDQNILWHAGVSEWKDVITGKVYRDLNRYSIGIEIVGPVNGSFSDAQRETVEDLILELCEIHKIPKERVIRHKDIAPKRKTDPADTLWSGKFPTYSAWIDSIFSLPQLMAGKFADALAKEQKASPNVKILTSFGGDQPLTEADTRQLLEIGLIRLARLLGKS